MDPTTTTQSRFASGNLSSGPPELNGLSRERGGLFFLQDNGHEQCGMVPHIYCKTRSAIRRPAGMGSDRWS